MGETRVDLLHLLEDLRDAYPGAVEEAILTEIMANALDSGASTISFDCDSAERALTVIDNGSGMQRRDLSRFHDIASSNKIRGQGIGFAGVGIKLGLLICEEVLTETRPAKLISRRRGIWHRGIAHRGIGCPQPDGFRSAAQRFASDCAIPCLRCSIPVFWKRA
jgi:Histidine kinase-, DNA gyrase B-, and HSP90-like ATPase